MAKFQPISESSQSSIDEHLLNFLKNKVNSFIKWDLVRFFHDNPHTREPAENIARFTGRDLKTIKQELQGLVEANVLESTTVSKVKIYRLVNDEDTRALIDRFMEACHDRQFRVEAIHHVIEGMQFSPRHDF